MFAHRISSDIELRLLEPRHSDELCDLTNRNIEHLRPWMVGGISQSTPDETREGIKECLHGLADDKLINCGIWYNGTLAGTVSIWGTDWRCRKARIGYWLGGEYQGKGLMTAAAGAVLSHAFFRMGLNRIELGTMVENSRSRAVADRLGFVQEGTSPQCYSSDDHHADRIWYALLRDEWNGATDGINFSHSVTPDCELRLLLPCDAETHYRVVADNQDHLRPWFPWAEDSMNVEGSRDFIAHTLHALADESEVHWGIWYRGEFAGIVGTSRAINRSSKSVSIGYWLGRNYQGKGLANLAVRTLLSHLFNTLDLNRVELRLDFRNTRSRKVAQRLNFTYEGTSRQSDISEGHPVDIEVYSLLRADFE